MMPSWLVTARKTIVREEKSLKSKEKKARMSKDNGNKDSG